RLVLRQAFVCFNRRFIKQMSCEKGKVVMSEENITRLYLYNKEIVLIGTAHVSKHSAAQVKDVIEGEQPDTVCVELDQQRYQSIVEKTKWQEMDIFKVIKERKAILLLVNHVVSSFQKRMAKQFGIRPGEEMIQGIESARDIGAELVWPIATFKSHLREFGGMSVLWVKSNCLCKLSAAFLWMKRFPKPSWKK